MNKFFPHPQTEATTVAFSLVFILLLWHSLTRLQEVREKVKLATKAFKKKNEVKGGAEVAEEVEEVEESRDLHHSEDQVPGFRPLSPSSDLSPT